jgi:two-component system, chemotaxis family, chemotaxis protein CheY
MTAVFFITQLCEMLKKEGFRHLDSANNADEAEKKMAAFPYNVVFLDWHMPGKSGLSLLEKWRLDELYSDAVIILVSAENEPSMIVEAVKAGALGYIVKPVTQQVLHEHIGRVMNRLNQIRKRKEAL